MSSVSSFRSISLLYKIRVKAEDVSPLLSKIFSWLIFRFILLGFSFILLSSIGYSRALNWDIDGDGSADALTDGLLILRYGFGLRGESLISGILSTESIMNTSEIEERLFYTSSILDIDANGQFDALTDGLLILRYLFGIDGDALISESVANNAQRNSTTEIIQYLQKYMPRGRLSEKRGISYGIAGGQQELSIQDLSTIGQRISWWYNWRTTSYEPTRQSYPELGIDFTPMAYNGDFNAAQMRSYLDDTSNVKYVLGFNEPNFENQANMTPYQAAVAWRKLEEIADEHDLKLIGPAVNHSSGEIDIPNTDDDWSAWEYLDAFFEECSDCRVDFIALHCYRKNEQNFKDFISEAIKYGKPIWLTEWAGNAGGQGTIWPESPEDHMSYLASTVRWLESQEYIYRYSWFIGRNRQGHENFPYNGLLGDDGKTTPLGEIYFSIPRKGYLYPSDIEIPAVGATTISGFSYTEISDQDRIVAVKADSVDDSILSFDFDIESSNMYDLEVRLASPANGSVAIIHDQSTLQVYENIDTGSFQDFETVVFHSISLIEGRNNLRLETNSSVSLSYVRLSKSTI